MPDGACFPVSCRHVMSPSQMFKWNRLVGGGTMSSRRLFKRTPLSICPVVIGRPPIAR